VEREKKHQIVDDLRGVFESGNLIVVARHTGLTVAETGDLRRQMRAAGAHYRVTKNRLARRALAGTRFAAIDSLFKGPTAIAYSDDAIAAAKVATAYAKKNEKLVLVGGALGEKTLTAEAVKALAELPSLDQLRAKLIGLLQAPASRIVGVLQAPAGQLARVINAYANKGEAA